jgi:Alpha/beta hydrolase domain
MHINTETEIATGVLVPNGLAYRRPDSDAPNDRYRLWEVPGSSHVSNDHQDPVLTLALNLAELLGITAAELPPTGCTHQQFVPGPTVGVPGVIDPNPFPFSNVENAAFADLTAWIGPQQTPPPHADRIEVTSTSPPTVVRDAFGNALGGVRTPFLDVPTATYVPTDTVAHVTPFSGFCILYGYSVPFSEDTLQSLYRNHDDYVSQVVGASSGLVQEGFWLHPDALDVQQQAVHSAVP